MKINGQTIILDQGEEITIKSGATQIAETPTQNTSNRNYAARLIIKNETGKPIQSTGEIRLYIGNHEVGINTYLPNAKSSAGALYTFNTGENNFTNMNVNCSVNGGFPMLDEYDGKPITEVRFYDQRHYNNIDAGFNATLDTNDSRCDSTLKKSGGTYIIKITNL